MRFAPHYIQQWLFLADVNWVIVVLVSLILWQEEELPNLIFCHLCYQLCSKPCYENISVWLAVSSWPSAAVRIQWIIHEHWFRQRSVPASTATKSFISEGRITHAGYVIQPRYIKPAKIINLDFQAHLSTGKWSADHARWKLRRIFAITTKIHRRNESNIIQLQTKQCTSIRKRKLDKKEQRQKHE